MTRAIPNSTPASKAKVDKKTNNQDSDETLVSNRNTHKVPNKKVSDSYDPAISGYCPTKNIASALVDHLFRGHISSIALCH